MKGFNKSAMESGIRCVFLLVLLSFFGMVHGSVAYDLSADDRVDSQDIGVLLSRWSSFDVQADLDDDGVVGVGDLGRLLLQWEAAGSGSATVYRVLNPNIQNGPLRIVSLTDNNTVRSNGTVIPLNRYEYQSIPGTTLLPGVVVEGDGAFSLGSEQSATDLPLPREFSGTAFVVPQVRGYHYYQVSSPYGDAEVYWQTDLDSGLLTVVKGTTTSIDAGNANLSAAIITSDIPVLVSHEAQTVSTQDVFPVPPVATELWGIRSQQAWVGALQDGTSISIYADDGSQANITLNAGEIHQVTLGADTGQGQGSAIHIVSDKPVGAMQIDDGDGLEASAFFATSHLANRYGIPVDAQYLAILCPLPDTSIVLDDGLLPQVSSCSANGDTPGKLYLGQATTGAHIPAGTILKSSGPVYVIYEANAQEAEHNLFGADAPWPDAPLLFNDGEIVNQSAYTLTGVADPGVMVDIFVNDLFQVEETADANGLIGADILLQEGDNKIYATAWDGPDESAPSAPITLTYEVIVPDAPVLNAAITPTSDNPYSVTGSAQPGVEIRLYVNGIRQQTAVADGGGAFSFSAYLYDGINAVHTTALLNGIESVQSNTLDIEYVNNVSRAQGGSITQNTVWTPGPASDPYTINSDLVIADGVSLVIMPGAVLRFTGNYKVQVDGALLIQGSETSPVMLTSGKASPAKGDWRGIVVSSSASRVVIDHAEIRHAITGIAFNPTALTDSGLCDTLCVRNSLIEQNSYYGLYIEGASPWIEGNLIQNNTRDGIYLTSASPRIKDNTIQNNGSGYSGIYVRDASNPLITGNLITGQRYGLYVYPASRSAASNPAPVVNGNGIYGNGFYDYYAYNFFDAANVTLDATGNWWGTTDPASIAAKIYDRLEHATYSPLVNFSSYLDAEGGSPVVVNSLLGTLTADTTLISGESYEVLGNLIVPAGITLTIPEGVVMHFDGGVNARLLVEGSLLIQGTEVSPVVLTSGQGTPAAGDWQGVVVSGSATQVVIDHAEIRHAVTGIAFNPTVLTDNGLCDTLCVRNSLIDQNSYYGLYIEGASPWIEGNLIQNNSRDGIYLTDASPRIKDNTIQNNGSSYSGIYVRDASNPLITGNLITGQRYGLYVYPASRSAASNPAPVVNGNGIYGNGFYDYYAYNFFDAANVTLDATGNWWGTTDPASIAAKIYDRLEHATYSPLVNFSSYLDAEGGSPVVVNNLLGTLTADTTLISGESYEVLGNLIVPTGITLTIPEGVVMHFDGGANARLLVDGSLLIQGTEFSPVVLTSGRGTPAAGDWQGVVVSGSATQVVIDHAEIRHAITGIAFNPTALTDSGLCDTLCVRNSLIEQNSYYGLYIEGASPWIEGNLIQNNTRDGIYLTSASPRIKDNTIQNNGSGYSGIYVRDASNPLITGNLITGQRYGLYVYPASRSAASNPAPVVNGNGIYGNGFYDYYAYNFFDAANVTLDATGNWWGTTDPASIAAKIYDRLEHATYSPLVNFSSYLDAEGGSPVVVNSLLGTLTADTTLISGESYEVLGNLIVPAGITLTIPEGVVMHFDGGVNARLLVEGSLLIQGTEVSPVVLTSGQGTPAAGDWQGVVVSGSATQVVIDHAEIRHAVTGIAFNPTVLTDNGLCDTLCVRNSLIDQNSYYGLYIEGASPWIEGNLIQNNSRDGIYLTDASPRIKDNTIQNNGSGYSGIHVSNASNPLITGNLITGQRYGVYVRPVTRSAANNSAPVVNGNGIYGNNFYDYYAYNFFDAANVTLDATGNWWGTTYRTSIHAKLYDSFDQATYSPTVDFTGYLDGLNGSPVPVVLLQGDLDSDAILTSENVYEVQGTLRVLSGVTLTLQAGTILHLDGVANKLIVEGSLIVQGTETEPVVLTSGQETPSTADWGGLFIAESATAVVIEHASIRYANHGIEFAPSLLEESGTCDTLCIRYSSFEYNNTAIVIDNASPWIERNLIQYNLDDGIHLNDASPNIRANSIRANGNSGVDDAGIDIRGASNPIITEGNQIDGNSRYGIYIYGSNIQGLDPAPLITGNGLYENTNFDLYSINFFDASNVTLNTTGNWWGSTDPAAIAARVYDNAESGSAPVADTSNFAIDPGLLGLVDISNVTQNQKTIHPLEGEMLEISFDLAAVQANVVMRIRSELDWSVLYESAVQLLSTGNHTLSWDGRDNGGLYVKDEAYVYELYASYDGRSDGVEPTPGSGYTAPGGGTADTSFNAYKNDFYKATTSYSQDVRLRVSIGYTGTHYIYDGVPVEAGVIPIIWDGRDETGEIVDGNFNIWFHDSARLATNLVIVKGTKPEISGPGPQIEVKSNPYRITHSYEQISSMRFSISSDSYVTVTFLPPGVQSNDSSAAIRVMDNQLLSARDGQGNQKEHPIEWLGYDASDTNDILMTAEGSYNFVIDATSVATGFHNVYRGALQVYR